jgi:hypothetical protein
MNQNPTSSTSVICTTSHRVGYFLVGDQKIRLGDFAQSQDKSDNSRKSKKSRNRTTFTSALLAAEHPERFRRVDESQPDWIFLHSSAI